MCYLCDEEQEAIKLTQHWLKVVQQRADYRVATQRLRWTRVRQRGCKLMCTGVDVALVAACLRLSLNANDVRSFVHNGSARAAHST
jgi:hypothetical protein